MGPILPNFRSLLVIFAACLPGSRSSEAIGVEEQGMSEHWSEDRKNLMRAWRAAADRLLGLGYDRAAVFSTMAAVALSDAVEQVAHIGAADAHHIEPRMPEAARWP
jgi:hypothetical protein